MKLIPQDHRTLESRIGPHDSTCDKGPTGGPTDKVGMGEPMLGQGWAVGHVRLQCWGPLEGELAASKRALYQQLLHQPEYIPLPAIALNEH